MLLLKNTDYHDPPKLSTIHISMKQILHTQRKLNQAILVHSDQVNLRSETHVAMAYDKVKSAPALWLG